MLVYEGRFNETEQQRAVRPARLEHEGAATTSDRAAIAKSATGRPEGFELLLLDGFAITRFGEKQQTPPFGSQRVLAFLALRAQAASRTFVAGNLWPGTTDCHAQASLRSALWRLHTIDCRVVEATRSHLQLSAQVTVDVREQVATCSRLLDPGAAPKSGTPSAPLEGSSFRVGTTSGCSSSASGSGNSASTRLKHTRGRFPPVASTVRRSRPVLSVLRADPLRESAHHLLIETHLAEGNRAEALRHLDLYRHLLDRRLGLSPPHAITQLLDECRMPTSRAKRGVDDGW